MLFLLSPRGRGIAPLIELPVVNRIFIPLLLLLRLHVLGANESHPGGGNSSTAPLPLYERGFSLKTSDTCASCALDRSSHREAAMICYGQYTIVLCFGQLF